MKEYPNVALHESFPDTHHDSYSKTVFGFWVYLMSDFILFGALFATYAVLRNNTFGGPNSHELFNVTFTLIQSLLLLTCSFTSGFAGACAHRKERKRTMLFFGITFLLGLVFMGMELAEFTRLLNAGHSWKKSAFLSAYFTVIGTHGIHMIFALLWIIVLLPSVYRNGITHINLKRLICLKMFWQFLNIIWIFIFTQVYLLGVKVI